jgi:hypothetical protein
MVISILLGALIWGQSPKATSPSVETPQPSAPPPAFEEVSREEVPGGGHIVHLASTSELTREVTLPGLYSFQSVDRENGTLGESCSLVKGDVVTTIAVYKEWVGVTRKHDEALSGLSNCPYNALLLIHREVFQLILDRVATEAAGQSEKEEAARHMLPDFTAGR